MAKSKVAEILKKLMLEKKITGTELAHNIGVSKQSVSEYLRGNVTPKSDVLIKIAEYFGVSPEFLLTGVEAQDKKERQELGLSGEAIRLLKSCDKKTFVFIDAFLSDPYFYSILSDALNPQINIKNVVIDDRDNMDKALSVIGFMVKKERTREENIDVIKLYFKNMIIGEKRQTQNEIKKEIDEMTKIIEQAAEQDKNRQAEA